MGSARTVEIRTTKGYAAIHFAIKPEVQGDLSAFDFRYVLGLQLLDSSFGLGVVSASKIALPNF